MDILLLLELILNFVDIYDVLLLDSAITNKKIRPHWKFLLHETPIHLNYYGTLNVLLNEQLGMQFLQFIMYKGIKLNCDFIFTTFKDFGFPLLEERFFRMLLIYSTNIISIDINVDFYAIKYIPMILHNNKNVAYIELNDNVHSHDFCHVLDIFTIIQKDVIALSFVIWADFDASIRICLDNNREILFSVNHEHLTSFNINAILNLCKCVKKITIWDGHLEDVLGHNIFGGENITFPDSLEIVHLKNVKDTEIMVMAIQKVNTLKKLLYSSSNKRFNRDHNMAEFKQIYSHVEIDLTDF
jgi:hypothetical protein